MNNNTSKKKGIFASSWLGVAAVWLGGHFGPGFATGAFSTTYYVRHGAPGILTPLIAMLVTGGVMYFMTEYARSHDVRNYKPFAMSCYGEKGGRIMSVLYDVTFLLTLLCAGGLAVSGEYTILNAQLGLPIIAGAVLTVVISALLCLYGSKLLSISSKYMMYAIVGVVLLISALALGIAGSGAALGMGPLLRTGTSVVGYIGIPVLVIPAFTVVRAKLGKSAEPQPDGVRGAA